MKELTGRVRGFLSGLALALAILAPLWFAAAAFGYRFGVIDLGLALRTMTFTWGPRLLMAALAIGAAALILAVIYRIAFGRARGGWVGPVLAVIVGAGGLWYAADVRATARALPPIHDITTDPEDPPQFSAGLIERRGPDANPIDYAAKIDPASERPLPEVQAEAYPDIGPILLDETPPEIAFEAALATARDMGWNVPTASPEAGLFEATATTFWFGFKDDVAVRVSPREGGGSRVDLRSVSRVGVSDLGANAARIRAFEDRLRRSVGEAEG